jgi:predicted O-methyltransferase YrrM
LVREIARERPKHILELGSGISTVICGYALERFEPEGRVISFDAESRFAMQTRQEIDGHGLQNRVRVCDAPLVSVSTPRGDSRWYNLDDYLAETSRDAPLIDLLIVDGPPGRDAALARYPALVRLAGRLKPGAVIVVDDAGRPDERRMVELWHEDFDLQQTNIAIAKGAILLRYNGRRLAGPDVTVH